MDFNYLFHIIVMGVVEGITEFLPISSTGHLILAAALLKLEGDKIKLFEIVIQSGAIFSVLTFYAHRLWSTIKNLPHSKQARSFTLHVFLGFFPAALSGVLFIDFIKYFLFNPLVVATSFIVGGLIMLWAEQKNKPPSVVDVEQIKWKQAIGVGLIQCIALVPGVSRSGATIIGGMLLGFSRKTATEFSFFLAIPMLLGAGIYDLSREWHTLVISDIPFFVGGIVAAWLSAWVTIKWLLHYVAHHTFIAFAWYRIAFGLLIIITSTWGIIHW